MVPLNKMLKYKTQSCGIYGYSTCDKTTIVNNFLEEGYLLHYAVYIYAF